MSGRIAAIIPMPTKLNEPRTTNIIAVGTFCTEQVELAEEERQHDEDDGRVDEAVHHRVHAGAQQLGLAPDRAP